MSTLITETISSYYSWPRVVPWLGLCLDYVSVDSPTRAHPCVPLISTMHGHPFLIPSLRLVLEGYVFTNVWGQQAEGLDILFAHAHVHCNNKTWQTGIYHDYSMTLISAHWCGYSTLQIWGLNTTPIVTPLHALNTKKKIAIPQCLLLTHWGRVTHICVSRLDHHWFR